MLGLRSAPGGEELSVSQLIQMKLKQITSGNIDNVDRVESTLEDSENNVNIEPSDALGMTNVGEWIQQNFVGGLSVA